MKFKARTKILVCPQCVAQEVEYPEKFTSDDSLREHLMKHFRNHIGAVQPHVEALVKQANQIACNIPQKPMDQTQPPLPVLPTKPQPQPSVHPPTPPPQPHVVRRESLVIPPNANPDPPDLGQLLPWVKAQFNSLSKKLDEVLYVIGGTNQLHEMLDTFRDREANLTMAEAVWNATHPPAAAATAPAVAPAVAAPAAGPAAATPQIQLESTPTDSRTSDEKEKALCDRIEAGGYKLGPAQKSFHLMLIELGLAAPIADCYRGENSHLIADAILSSNEAEKRNLAIASAQKITGKLRAYRKKIRVPDTPFAILIYSNMAETGRLEAYLGCAKGLDKPPCDMTRFKELSELIYKLNKPFREHRSRLSAFINLAFVLADFEAFVAGKRPVELSKAQAATFKLLGHLIHAGCPIRYRPNPQHARIPTIEQMAVWGAQSIIYSTKAPEPDKQKAREQLKNLKTIYTCLEDNTIHPDFKSLIAHVKAHFPHTESRHRTIHSTP